MSNDISRFEQDFESNTANWFGSVTRVTSDPSGANSGTAYAAVDAGAYTRFGSYSSEFAGGYTTSIAIYIDPAWVDGTGFEYSVASSTQHSELPSGGGGHRRDFVFSVVKDADGNVYVNGSNNAGSAPPTNLGSNPTSGAITTAGWYVFEHTFRDNGDGTLAVDMSVYAAGSPEEPIFETTRNNSSDTLADMVGGNRYGWFVNNNTGDTLKVDSVSLYEAEGYGTVGKDTIVGSAADETFYVSPGNDVIDGGAGTDTYDASAATSGVTVDLDTNPFSSTIHGDGFATGDASVGFDGLTSIENVRGSAFDDIINGSDGDNVFYASAGNDIIDGSGQGAAGDTFDASASSNNLNIDLDAGSASGIDATSTVTLVDIENAVGGSGNDTIVGSSANNTLVGNDGDDTFVASAGQDNIDGGAGADSVQFAGNSDAYAVTWDGTTAVVTEIGNPANVTTIENAGTLEFGNGQKIILVAAGTEFATIQSGVDAAANGDIVMVAEGTYAETVNVTDRAITIQGVGNVTVDGTFLVSDAMDAGDVMRFANLNIDADGFTYGISVRSSAVDVPGINAGTVELDHVNISNANGTGLFYAHPSNGSNPANPNTIGAFIITDSEFTDNGQVHTGAKGKGHINLFGFNGDLIVSNSDFTSPTDGLTMPAFNGSVASGTEVYPHKAISVSGIRIGTAGVGGFEDGGQISFTNVTVSGTYGSDAVSIYDQESIASGSQFDIDFQNTTAAWGLVNVDGVGGLVDLSMVTGTNLAEGAAVGVMQGLATGDTAYGSAGDDVFVGRDGADIMVGNDGNDVFFGGAGGDNMQGGEGNDTFIIGSSADASGDVIDGGNGDDAINFVSTTNGDTLTITSDVSNVESVVISGDANTGVDASAATSGLKIIGDDSDNSITGSAFNDVIDGGLGSNTLDGGAGDDVFLSNGGSNVIEGGADTDTVVYSGSVSVAFTASGWTAADDTLNGVEVVEDDGHVYRLVGNGGYASIQDAIAAADAGDIILIGEGTYSENITIDKAVTLRGMGEVVLSAASGSAVVFGAVGGDVSIENIDIQGNGTASNAIVVDDGDDIGTLSISGGAIGGFAANGLFVLGDNVDAVMINGTSLSDSGGFLVKLYDFTGDAAFTDVSASGAGGFGAFELVGTPNNELADSAPIGTVSFTNVTVDGEFSKAAVGVYNFTNADGMTVSHLDISGVEQGPLWPVVNLDGFADTLDASGFDIVSVDGQVIALQGEKFGQPGDGENVIQGTDGNDLLIGKLGNDMLFGNDGNDTFVGSHPTDASLGAGEDTFVGGAGLDNASYADTVLASDFSVDEDGNWVLNTAGGGTDHLQVELVTHGGTGTFLLVGGAGGYANLQDAIAAANAGDTILVTGTQNGNFTVNKSDITIVGVGDAKLQGTFASDNSISGSVADWLQSAHSYSNVSGNGLTVAGSNVVISGLAIDGYLHAVQLGHGIDNVRLEGLDISGSVVGYDKATSAAISNVTIAGGSIMDSYIGVDFAKATGAAGMASNVTIDGTHFEHLTEKGIYVETFDQSSILNVTMDDVGTFGRGYAFASKTPYDQTGEFGTGIDINLKYGDYSGIVIDGFEMTNVGVSSGPDTVPQDFGAAIGIKVRDDGSYGGANAATYSGDVLVQNGSIDVTSTGIRAGEPGKMIGGPSVVVDHVTIDNATVSDLDNVTNSTLTVTAGDDDVFHAAPTSTGNIVFVGDGDANTFTGGSGNDTFTGAGGDDIIHGGAGIDTVVYDETVTITANAGGDWTISGASSGTDSVDGVEIVQQDGGPRVLLVGGGGFASLADALVAANDGDTIMLSVGTHVGDATVSKSVTILGANAGVDGTATRGAESVIDGKITINAAGPVVVDGVEFLHNELGGYALGMTSAGHTVTNSLFYSTVAGGSTFPDFAIFVGPIASGEIHITDNFITGDASSYYSGASWRSGIWSDGGGVETHITGNTIEWARTGANLDSFSNPDSDVSGNTFIHSGSGVAFGVGSTGIDAFGSNTFEGVDTDINIRNLNAPVTLDVSGQTLNPTATDEYFLVDGSTTAADTIIGTAGKDYLLGNGGNDILVGGGGEDILVGGAGVDTARYSGDITIADITSGSGTFSVDGGADGVDLISGIEIVEGTNGRILLVGNGGFASLSDAVAYAEAGDTIVLGDGNIGSGTVVIGAELAGLKIIGAGHGADASGADPSVSAGASTFTGRIIVQAENVVIDGIRLVQGASGSPFDSGAIVVSADNLTVENSVFYRVGGLTDGYRAIVTDVGKGEGLAVMASVFTGWSTGIYANGSNDITVTGNSFTDNNVGMSLDTYATLTDADVSGNTFSNAFENIGIGDALATLDVDTLIGANTYIGGDKIGVYALGSGDQVIIGTDGADTIEATFNAFKQTVTGGLGDDVIHLGDGDDFIIYNLGDGNDTISGGAGVDQLDIRAGAASSASSVTLSNSAVSINGAMLALDGVENIKLTLPTGNFADTVDASGFTAGKLEISLGGGNDTYVAANGSGHVVNGGAGVDLIDLSAITSGVTLNLASSSLTGVGFSQTISGFENIRGSAFADALYGNSSANIFYASLGNDLINGGAGVDTYDASGIAVSMNIDLNGIASSVLFNHSLTSIENAIGTAQDDYIYGNNLANTLNGGAGNDQLFGGAGNDVLIGGDGIDTAVFQGNRSQYLINYAAGTITGVDGTDTFSGIEQFQFDDMLLTLQTKGDYNGNFRADLLFADNAHVDPSKGAPLVLRDGGAPGTSIDMGHVFGNTLLGTADFDGDGKTDILQTTASGWHSFRSGGDVNVNIGNVGNRSVIAVGDFNGDGKDDVLLKSPSDYLSMLESAQTNLNIGSIAGKTVIGIGDINGDGRDDILLKSTANSFLSYLSVTDSGIENTDLGVQSGRSLIGLADVNGDGQDELVFQNANGWVSYLNGSSIGFQTNRSLVGVGDFNGDGKDDLLFQNNSNGFLNYFSAGQTNVNVGLFTGKEVVGIGDYDGDGRDDILIQDTTTHEMSYLSHGSASAVVPVSDIAGLDLVFHDNGLGVGDDMLFA